MGPRVACFAMAFGNHFNGLVAVVDELVRAGAVVGVWTDRRFEADVVAAGAVFAPLFEPVSLDEVDDRSRPRSARGVTFAAARGDAVADQVRAFGAELVFHDGFAFIGRLVAERLGLPRVILTSGHAVHPARFRAALEHDDARVDIDPRCHAAVARLRDAYGIADASPFSYVADPSPWLNINKEPPQWLSLEERGWLGPTAFFGSLRRGALDAPPATRDRAGPLRVYAAFGTVIWQYWTEPAVAALATLAGVLAARGTAPLRIGLGGASITAADRARLEAAGAEVLAWADQPAELSHAELFVTHHGLSSTHEAVARGIPMLSCPFFWDQPALAARTQEFGLALPIGNEPLPRAPLAAEAIHAALDAFDANREAMVAVLAAARQWEAEVMETRPDAARQILALAN